jgi:hypothetical protein
MKTFSVLTVSKRTGWEDMATESLAKQTVQPDKWVVVAENVLHMERPLVVFAPKQIRLSNLNASLNEGLRHIDTDYVIFYQDFIELPEDCFEKLLNLVDEKTFVTTCTPNYDGSDDGRYTGVDLPRLCRPEEWEANVAIAPMKMIRELGGFPETYDLGWAWDNVNVAMRAAMLGARFICDESNRPKLYPHEMSSHETLPKNADRHDKEMRDIRAGLKPLRYDYLK